MVTGPNALENPLMDQQRKRAGGFFIIFSLKEKVKLSDVVNLSLRAFS